MDLSYNIYTSLITINILPLRHFYGVYSKEYEDRRLYTLVFDMHSGCEKMCIVLLTLFL
jgi:hypothetical protein